MLPWWGWVVFWAVFVGRVGAFWLGVLVRGGLGEARALGGEVSGASALCRPRAAVDELSEVDPPPMAVTQPVHRVRGEYRSSGLAVSRTDGARRAERLPHWARVD